MSKWYIIYNGQQVGPMEKEQLLAYGLNPNSQVWSEGMPMWVLAYTIPELMSLISSRAGNGYSQQYPGMNPGMNNVPPAGQMYGDCGTSGKSKTTAGLFALLLGGLGIQYFYLDRPGIGALCILFSLLTCGLWGTLMFIQGIIMLTMTQQQFEQKYVYTQSSFPLF